jgi:RNA polymerase sigma factor (sigma-70 family)
VAFRCRNRYDLSRADARPWLYGIVSNLMARHRRAEVRRWRALARAAAPAAEETMADDVADRVGARALRRELTAALVELPARQREVILLIAWAELDYAEAAEALGVPLGTVRSRLHRARAALRASLAELIGDEEVTCHG